MPFFHRVPLTPSFSASETTFFFDRLKIEYNQKQSNLPTLELADINPIKSNQSTNQARVPDPEPREALAGAGGGSEEGPGDDRDREVGRRWNEPHRVERVKKSASSLAFLSSPSLPPLLCLCRDSPLTPLSLSPPCSSRPDRRSATTGRLSCVRCPPVFLCRWTGRLIRFSRRLARSLRCLPRYKGPAQSTAMHTRLLDALGREYCLAGRSVLPCRRAYSVVAVESAAVLSHVLRVLFWSTRIPQRRGHAPVCFAPHLPSPPRVCLYVCSSPWPRITPEYTRGCDKLPPGFRVRSLVRPSVCVVSLGRLRGLLLACPAVAWSETRWRHGCGTGRICTRTWPSAMRWRGS